MGHGVASRMFVVMRLRQGKRIGDGSTISSVVPAKAGTHTSRNLKRKTEPTPGTTITAGGYGSLLSQGRPAGVSATDGELPFLFAGEGGGGEIGLGMVRQYHLSVVPAKAGTHTPRNLKRKTEPTPGTTITAGGYGSLLSQGRPAGVSATDGELPFLLAGEGWGGGVSATAARKIKVSGATNVLNITESVLAAFPHPPSLREGTLPR